MEKNETTGITTDVLTVRQALDAMFEFLVQYYRETHSDGVGSLLGGSCRGLARSVPIAEIPPPGPTGCVRCSGR